MIILVIDTCRAEKQRCIGHVGEMIENRQYRSRKFLIGIMCARRAAFKLDK